MVSPVTYRSWCHRPSSECFFLGIEVGAVRHLDQRSRLDIGLPVTVSIWVPSGLVMMLFTVSIDVPSSK